MFCYVHPVGFALRLRIAHRPRVGPRVGAMTGHDDPDLAACRTWRPSAPLGSAWVGLIPAWNAVTLLNPAAAAIWDLLIDCRDLSVTASLYAERFPTRADFAAADVAACVDAWQAQGFFRPPPESDEAAALRALAQAPHVPVHPGRAAPAYRRTLLSGAVPVRLEVDDPMLAAVIADLLVDFTETTRPPRHVLHATGPEGGWVLLQDGQPARLARNLAMARGQIVAELVRIAGETGGWRATIHGAVLTSEAGAVFLAGESGAGKSTLSAGLVARGWRLIAEDLAAFGAAWRVHPLPFALSIKDGSVPVLAADFPGLATARVHRLGPRNVRYQSLPDGARATRPETPMLFLDVRYTPELGTAPPVLDRLTEVEALSLFTNDESYIGFDREDTGDFFDFIARTPAYRLRHGDTAAAERAIRECLGAHAGNGAAGGRA